MSDTTYDPGALVAACDDNTDTLRTSEVESFQKHFRLDELEIWVELNEEAREQQLNSSDRDERVAEHFKSSSIAAGILFVVV